MSAALKSFLLFDLLVLIMFQNRGCTGGKVVDELGLPVIGAQAVCEDMPALAAVFTDVRGVYQFPDGAIPEGRHTFVISMAGYETVRITANVKYAPAPGHTAAQGLIFQVPDVKLRKAGTAAAVLPTLTPETVAPPPTRPPPQTTPAPVTMPTLVEIDLPTLPPVTLPPTGVSTSTTVPSPGTLPERGPGTSVVTTTTLAQLAAPGELWYRSPEQGYSFSAPPDWRVGFSGDQAQIIYSEGGCEALRLSIQSEERAGRPNSPVERDSTVVLSGNTARVIQYKDGTIRYEMACGQVRFVAFKSLLSGCRVRDPVRLEQQTLQLLTTFRCP